MTVRGDTATQSVVRFCLAHNASSTVIDGWAASLQSQISSPNSPLLQGDTTASVDASFGLQTAPTDEPTSDSSSPLSGVNLYLLLAAIGVVVILAVVLVMYCTKTACFGASSSKAAATSSSSKALEFTDLNKPVSAAPISSASAPAPTPSPAAQTTIKLSAGTGAAANPWSEQYADGRK